MLSVCLVVAIFIIIAIAMNSSFPELHSQLYKKDLGLEAPSQKPRERALVDGPADLSVFQTLSTMLLKEASFSTGKPPPYLVSGF